ncbi:MAG: hypothetical protein PUA83_04720 [Clostridiales bacterium]|nr:hypothetical protein [Clostridiales bacterium]
MTKSEALIRTILGPVRRDIRPLAYAVDITAGYLFVGNIPMEDIHITKQIYPAVSERIGKSCDAVTKCIERLTNLCWDSIIEQDMEERYIGKQIHDISSASDMLFYLAFYMYYGAPFFEVVEKKARNAAGKYLAESKF